MARDIDRKLHLTAAFLGAVTCKDLAAAFRRANAATSFDVDRAHKWLQGRAHPRQLQVYEDWAKLLDLGRSGQWIAECDTERFLEAMCTRHGIDGVELRRQVDLSNRLAGRPERDAPLAGYYACYSHAWSPYFRGRLIRGELSITAGPTQQRLLAAYTEVLPTGRLRVEGTVTTKKRAMHLDLRDNNGEAHLAFCLSVPTPPASVLVGFMCGATVLGPDAEPSVTRIAIVRLPGLSARLGAAEAYLPSQASVAEDLAELGMRVADPAVVNRCLTEFLGADKGNGLDQISAQMHRSLVEVFDRTWMASAAINA